MDSSPIQPLDVRTCKGHPGPEQREIDPSPSCWSIKSRAFKLSDFGRPGGQPHGQRAVLIRTLAFGVQLLGAP